MKEIQGPFKVKGIPAEADSVLTEMGAMRMRFDKTFEGALNATSIVSMMGLMNPEKMAGAYVALEKVTGSIEGKSGSFCLYHCSSANAGVNVQSIQVVPESGTGELAGLKGSMEIDNEKDVHSYRFKYEL
ncbi:MAG: DUF3224 domain-containing protein [Proteobacteria bacterium]|nr:MAG: DUF3224 domain-containing protein [Pseudomonadota bacterium]